MSDGCSYCHRRDGGHSPGCKRRRQTTNRPGACRECGMIRHQADSTCSLRKKKAETPVRRAVPPPDLPTNGARETARMLLGQLEALRAKLDADIATVRALSEVL